MPDKHWKAFERRIADRLGGRRRGPDYRSEDGGKDDVIHPLYSVECKVLGRPSFSDLVSAVAQAEANAPSGKMPIAIVKKKQADDRNSLVIMRLETWETWNC